MLVLAGITAGICLVVWPTKKVSGTVTDKPKSRPAYSIKGGNVVFHGNVAIGYENPFEVEAPKLSVKDNVAVAPPKGVGDRDASEG